MRDPRQLSLQISDREETSKVRGDGHLTWAGVLRAQDWGTIILNVLLIIALIITVRVADEPRQRPFSLYDATISYPHNPDSIPYWVAVLVPFLCLLISIAAGEAWRVGGRPGVKRATASILHLVLDGIFAFVVTAQVTQVGKVLVGRLRPDFLARCNPTAPAQLTVQWGLAASANPACDSPLTADELRDGHYSFPSGHSSTAFVFAVYSVGYGIWVLYHRDRVTRLEVMRRGVGHRLTDALVAALGLLWLLAQLSFAWGVAISRVIDYRHHPADVVGGALLGTSFAVLYITRCVGRLAYVTTAIAIEAGDFVPGSDDGAPPTP
ncbi:hypothetical protein APUTEX25_001100 [Auxenochlorella protothecoides]|uniref:Phosphatidic acid phosphatase type 2/haloperoxidase domain-containing protein n=1 Tax=Auxenochlorella protothecoides TaxID=3075 RepID=A0A1D1ZN90_AUXPR|nr:hypothetical protein APUTEX25_001100 [Auxenochlorella protothecoides]|eukprot:RMZ52981.1 hypothetical protein APUTEX25_001100 [Auxenochlorella protothecoides]